MGDTKDPIQINRESYGRRAESYKAGRSDLSRDEENRRYFSSNLKGKKILDIGCAHGRDVGEFYKKGMTVTGIDLTPEFIALAKKEYPNVDLQVMDMRDLKFDNHMFDGIRACASLLHIPKSEVTKTLEGFHRVLKKGGLLYIGVKEGSGEKYEIRKQFNNEERFFAYRQQDEIEQKLKRCKFSIRKSSINNPINSDSAWINIFAIAE